MIKIEEALAIILDNINSLEFETVSILETLDRVLAEDIFSDEDIPPFDNSAMDGYAVIASDAKGASDSESVILEVIEELPAGYEASAKVTSGKAVKIMTGAPMPKGADAVVMVEYTKMEDSRVLIFKELSPGTNVRRAGEDVKKGDKVLKKGTLVRPAEIGMLAALGQAKVTVVRQPRVAILSTGDELVDIGEKLSHGKIRNSNTYSLYAQTAKVNCIPEPCGPVIVAWYLPLTVLTCALIKFFLPNFLRISSSRIALMTGFSKRLLPDIFKRAGRTNCSKDIIIDTGLPGRPKTGFALRVSWGGIIPNRSGFPGFMATFQNFVSIPSSTKTPFTRSYSPTLTPPEIKITSAD